jgi:hypothetical protein
MNPFRMIVTSALLALSSACALSAQDPAPTGPQEPPKEETAAPQESVSPETLCPKGEIYCYCPQRGGGWCTTIAVCRKLCPYG